jgi:hypothetical protein
MRKKCPGPDPKGRNIITSGSSFYYTNSFIYTTISFYFLFIYSRTFSNISYITLYLIILSSGSSFYYTNSFIYTTISFLLYSLFTLSFYIFENIFKYIIYYTILHYCRVISRLSAFHYSDLR